MMIRKKRDSSGSMIMRRIDALCLAISVFAFLFTASCATKKPHINTAKGPSWNAERLLVASRDSARESMKETNRRKAKELAQKGVGYAEHCLMLLPEEAGCYYWRAINTGLYYRVHIIGYQRGVKKMIEDCHKVIDIDASYDHGGAYRVLGQIYTQLPQTGGHADSITRDLPLAEHYLRKALRLAPDYPENHLALAETLLAQGKIAEAIKALTVAQELVPQWRNDTSYEEWKHNALTLEREIARASE